ncbi:MAG TPA: hypothetical protein VGF75_06280 [Candidatus Saccharimonadales bacterium]|jgi:hypothetical protein
MIGDTTDVTSPDPTNATSGSTSFSSTSSGITALRNSLGTDNTVGAPASTNKFVWTDGWYVAIACTFGVITADTKIGPLVSGILTVGLIYQLTLLIQGK